MQQIFTLGLLVGFIAREYQGEKNYSPYGTQMFFT